MGAVTGTTFQIAYLLTVDGEARATAVTVHGCTDRRAVRRCPPGYARSSGHETSSSALVEWRSEGQSPRQRAAWGSQPRDRQTTPAVRTEAVMVRFASAGSSARATTMPACMIAPRRRCASGSTAAVVDAAHLGGDGEHGLDGAEGIALVELVPGVPAEHGGPSSITMR